MKSKIYSSEYMKSSSKGQRWIPAFAMIAFLLAFPVAELILMGKWNERSYTQSQLSYLYSPRKVDFYHSLPVKRSALFLSLPLSGSSGSPRDRRHPAGTQISADRRGTHSRRHPLSE